MNSFCEASAEFFFFLIVSGGPEALFIFILLCPDGSPSKDWQSTRLRRLPGLNPGLQVYSLVSLPMTPPPLVRRVKHCCERVGGDLVQEKLMNANQRLEEKEKALQNVSIA
jgi:hypothetical protein